MKNLRRLTRAQKIRLSRLGLDPSEYLLHSETETALIVINRATGKRTEIAKPPRR